MRFIVTWTDAAYDDLADAYLRFGNAQSVLDDVIRRVEHTLSTSADKAGRFADNGRYLREYPLTVFYTIDTTAMEATILSVALTL